MSPDAVGVVVPDPVVAPRPPEGVIPDHRAATATAAVAGPTPAATASAHSDPNRGYVIGLLSVAVLLPLLAVGWVVLSGLQTTPRQKPVVATAVTDDGIVNINGTVPGGFIAGTGMVLTSSGLVLTNNHVVADTSDLTAQLAGRGPVYNAVVVGVDPTQDVAVIRLEGATGLPVTPFDLSGSLAVGDPVTGLGNALGRNGAPVRATGTVTSLDETIFVEDEEASIVETLDGVVCFNAPIQPGDSGGPLINAGGRVIGMDTAGALTSATLAGAKWGCAIPITRAMTIAQQIESGTRPVLQVRASRHPRCERRVADRCDRLRPHCGHPRRCGGRRRDRRRGCDHHRRRYPCAHDAGLQLRHAGPEAGRPGDRRVA